MAGGFCSGATGVAPAAGTETAAFVEADCRDSRGFDFDRPLPRALEGDLPELLPRRWLETEVVSATNWLVSAVSVSPIRASNAFCLIVIASNALSCAPDAAEGDRGTSEKLPSGLSFSMIAR